MERIALFIDGPNLYAAAKNLGIEIDYQKLRVQFLDPGDILFRASYFAVTAEDGAFEPIVKLIDWLEFNGYAVFRKEGQPWTDPATGTRKVRGILSVEIATEALMMAPHYDCAVIMSGDGELAPLVEALMRLGKRVVIVSTITPPATACSTDLRRLADYFIDLENIRAQITRDKRATVPPAATHKEGALA